MATVVTLKDRKTGRPSGYRRLDFRDREGKRRELWLGEMCKRDAEAVRVKVEAIVSARIGGAPTTVELSQWLADIGAGLAARLAKCGLVEPRREAGAKTLGPFLAEYVKGRSDVKKSTVTVYAHTRRCLLKYFGGRETVARDYRRRRRLLAGLAGRIAEAGG